MATIVNTPASDSGNSMALVVGLILLAVMVGLFFLYGFPALMQSTGQSNQPPISVPERIDVNINPGQ
jgi:hypothetical protein